MNNHKTILHKSKINSELINFAPVFLIITLSSFPIISMDKIAKVLQFLSYGYECLLPVLLFYVLRCTCIIR